MKVNKEKYKNFVHRNYPIRHSQSHFFHYEQVHIGLPRAHVIQSCTDNMNNILLNNDKKSYTSLLQMFSLLGSTMWPTLSP
jgi:hypothetical protein